MGCMSSKQLLFKVLMANEVGKYEISGYLLFREGQEGSPQAIRCAQGEPSLMLLNHWKEQVNPESSRFCWKISQIKTYGYCHETFMFECRSQMSAPVSSSSMPVAMATRNRSASQSSNSERFLFKTPQARQMFKLLQLWCHEEALKMERGFDATFWAKNEEKLSVCKMETEVHKHNRCGNDSPREHLLAISNNRSPILAQNPSNVREQRTSGQEPTHPQIVYVNYENNNSTDQQTHYSGTGKGRRQSGLYSSLRLDRNNNDKSTFANPCTEDGRGHLSTYSALNTKHHHFASVIDEEQEEEENVPATTNRQDSCKSDQLSNQNLWTPPNYVNCVQPETQTTVANDYCNIDTPNSVQGRSSTTPDSRSSCYSSGVGSLSSSYPATSNVFQFPTDSSQPSGSSGKAVVEIHHHHHHHRQGISGSPVPLNVVGSERPSPRPSNTQLSVIYSELDDSIATNSTGNLNDLGRKRSRSVASSRDSNSAVVYSGSKKRSGVGRSGVAYCQLDVEKTRALATTLESRTAENRMRQRRASMHAQVLANNSSTNSASSPSAKSTTGFEVGSPSAIGARRSWSNSVRDKKGNSVVAVTGAARLTRSCLSIRSLRRHKSARAEKSSNKH